MKVTFVTGTDTDVGKTVATAALAARTRALGRSPFVIKPVQTGLATDPGDLAEVRRLVGNVPGVVGAELEEALAPTVAARRAKITLPGLAEQLATLVVAAENYDEVYVEGAGGLRVPLGFGFDMLDLADAARRPGLALEFVVVVRVGLGTLNHSMLTVETIRRSGHKVSGLVIGSVPRSLTPVEELNLGDLPRMTEVPVLAHIPERVGQLSTAEFCALAPGWFVEG